MKTTAKFLSALVIAAATALTIPAHAAWSSRLTQPWLGRNAATLNRMSPMMLSGREVIAMNGHRIGRVVDVDRVNGTVRVRTPQGMRLNLPKAGLRNFGGDLLALNMTRRDLRDWARLQG